MILADEDIERLHNSTQTFDGEAILTMLDFFQMYGVRELTKEQIHMYVEKTLNEEEKLHEKK